MNERQRELMYWRSVVSIARKCSGKPDPDREFHRVVGPGRLSRAHFRDVMDFSEYPGAYSDWLGDEVETYSNGHWQAVQDQVTYMAFRADVLSEVARIKEEG